MINIALVDDHPMLTSTLGTWLTATGRFSIVGTATTLAGARSLFKKLDPLPEIVVLDVSLGGSASREAADGLALIPELKEICAKRGTALPGIVVFTMHEDLFIIQRAMDLGAKAYVAKSAQTEEFTAAIDAVLAGNTYINPKYKMKEQQHAEYVLTRRENEIAALVKQSLTARQIAERLFLSIRTVESHLAHIYIKTGVTSWEGLRDL